MDEFVEIPGYPGYKINRNGDCIGIYGRRLKPSVNQKNYYRYTLKIDGAKISRSAHRRDPIPWP